MNHPQSLFDLAFNYASSLDPKQRIHLVQKIMGSLEEAYDAPTQKQPLETFYGLLTGIDISEEDINEVRREMWQGFADEDEDLL